MKNWRKTCSLFLCLVICLSLLPTSALGEEPELFPGDNGDESEYETVEGAVIGSSEEPDAAETDLNNGLADLDMADDPEENTEEYMGSNDDAEIAKDETDSPEQIVSDGFGAAETDVPDEPEVSGIEETPEVSEKQEQPEPQDEPELPADDQEVLPDETEEQDGPSLVYRNPLYEDTLSEEVLLDQDDTFELVPTAANRYTDLESAARYVRSRAVLREKSISFLYPRKNFTEETYLTIFEIALMHTGVPTEGDYLRWQYGGWRGDAKYSGDDWLITYTVTYYTTAAQEEEVNRQVAAVLSQLLSGGMSAIDKFTAIYRYISDHVTYDYDNLDNPYYVLMFTAYAALINRTAVCQGYSLLLYRMLLSAGIECRLISGYSEGTGHAWNIVRIGNVYYNADVTWDAARSSYNWFLLCDAHFYDHYRDTEYDTDAFYSVYQMSYSDYSPENPDPIAVRFTDVRDPSAYYYDPVYWAYGGGISSGTGATTFSPGNSCTRAQIVTFLWKAMGSPEPSSGYNPFTDVKTTDYFYKPVLWAKENGITAGKTAATFEPYSPCTRGQIVTFLWIAKGRPEPASMYIPFLDVEYSDYFLKPILWAKENGITSGTSATTFSPGRGCTRAQAMTFLYVASNLPDSGGAAEFAPSGQVTIIVAYGEGSGTDNTTRLLAKYAEKYVGQNIVIENRSGDSGSIGWTQLADANPDGLTIGIINLPSFSHTIVNDMGVYTVHSFAPICTHVKEPSIVIVRANDSRFQDLNSLIQYGRKNQGTKNELEASTNGPKASNHIGAQVFANSAGFSYRDIPMAGTSDQLLSLLDGEADFCVVKLSDIAGIETEFRILGVFAEERLPELSDIPTLQEAGCFIGWLGTARCIVAPAGVSGKVIAFYEKAFQQAMADPDYLRAAEEVGMTTNYKDAKETGALILQQQVFAESLTNDFWHED